MGFSLDLEPSMTVLEVKSKVAQKCEMEPSQMKIIFKGKILKDSETLEGVQVTAGCAMHVVKSAPSAGAAAATSTPASNPSPAPTSAPSPSPPSNQPSVPVGGMDPAMMQAMMGGM